MERRGQDDGSNRSGRRIRGSDRRLLTNAPKREGINARRNVIFLRGKVETLTDIGITTAERHHLLAEGLFARLRFAG